MKAMDRQNTLADSVVLINALKVLGDETPSESSI